VIKLSQGSGASHSHAALPTPDTWLHVMATLRLQGSRCSLASPTASHHSLSCSCSNNGHVTFVFTETYQFRKSFSINTFRNSVWSGNVDSQIRPFFGNCLFQAHQRYGFVHGSTGSLLHMLH